jgi:hypothetical protein
MTNGGGTHDPKGTTEKPDEKKGEPKEKPESK